MGVDHVNNYLHEILTLPENVLNLFKIYRIPSVPALQAELDTTVPNPKRAAFLTVALEAFSSRSENAVPVKLEARFRIKFHQYADFLKITDRALFEKGAFISVDQGAVLERDWLFLLDVQTARCVLARKPRVENNTKLEFLIHKHGFTKDLAAVKNKINTRIENTLQRAGQCPETPHQDFVPGLSPPPEYSPPLRAVKGFTAEENKKTDLEKYVEAVAAIRRAEALKRELLQAAALENLNSLIYYFQTTTLKINYRVRLQQRAEPYRLTYLQHLQAQETMALKMAQAVPALPAERSPCLACLERLPVYLASGCGHVVYCETCMGLIKASDRSMVKNACPKCRVHVCAVGFLKVLY